MICNLKCGAINGSQLWEYKVKISIGLKCFLSFIVFYNINTFVKLIFASWKSFFQSNEHLWEKAALYVLFFFLSLKILCFNLEANPLQLIDT